MTPSQVHAAMARQDCVVTLAQALGAGMSKSAVSRRVRSAEWRRLTTGVYLRADRARTPAVDLRAAVFASGPESRHALRVTGLSLSVLEAAVTLRDGSALMDRAIQRHTTIETLQAVHERNPGRHGASAAAQLLRAAGEGGASEAERMLHRLLRQAGLTGWCPHVRSCGYEIDVAFVSERVAIEVDGWAWHRDVDRFNRDAQRQNALMNAGWHVLRFTWHHLRNDPEGVIAQVRQALAG